MSKAPLIPIPKVAPMRVSTLTGAGKNVSLMCLGDKRIPFSGEERT